MFQIKDLILFLTGMVTCFIIMTFNNTFTIKSNHGLRNLLEEVQIPILSSHTVPNNQDSHHNHHNNHHNHIGKKYFIDFGANTGDTIQHFVLPKKNINETENFMYNYDIKGYGSDGNWHIVAVEANPIYTPLLENLKSKYLLERKIQSFQLFGGTAVFTSEGNLTFHLDGKGEGSMGSSLLSNSFSVLPHNNTITVKQINISHLFHGLLHLQVEDFVVLKIDIEGAEFDLLRRIISHGLLHLIDTFAIEWHDENYWFTGPSDEIKQFYKKQHDCINWIIADTAITNIDWHR